MQKNNPSTAIAVCLAGLMASSAHALDITVSGSDSTAIQTAIDQVAAAGGGTVWLPARTYMINSKILVKTNVRLDGAGNTSLLRGPNNAFTYTMVETAGTTASQVRDVKIDGWGGGQDIGIGLHIIAGSDITIANVNVTNYRGNGFNGNTTNLTTTNCYFDRNGGGYNHNSYFRDLKTGLFAGNTSVASAGCGFKFGGTPGHHITLSGNTARYNAYDGITMQDSPTDNVVKNNTCNNNYNGIQLGGVNLLVDSNTCHHNKNIGLHTWGGSGVIQYNKAGWNGLRNFDIHGSFTQIQNF